MRFEEIDSHEDFYFLYFILVIIYKYRMIIARRWIFLICRFMKKKIGAYIKYIKIIYIN